MPTIRGAFIYDGSCSRRRYHYHRSVTTDGIKVLLLVRLVYRYSLLSAIHCCTHIVIPILFEYFKLLIRFAHTLSHYSSVSHILYLTTHPFRTYSISLLIRFAHTRHTPSHYSSVSHILYLTTHPFRTYSISLLIRFAHTAYSIKSLNAADGYFFFCFHSAPIINARKRRISLRRLKYSCFE
jgi:hypothetical protein